MVAVIEGTPAEGTRTRSAAPSLLPIGFLEGTLTTLEVLAPRQAESRAIVRKRLIEPYDRERTFTDLMSVVGHLSMRVQSPCLARTLAVKEAPDGFIALEHVDGLALNDLLRLSRGTDTVRFIVPVLLDVLSGLSVLHHLKSASGEDTPVVHQAPCARHIVVGHDGRARLCDMMHAAASGLPPTPERQRFLRPEEMSPEQASGTGHIDARCDVFIVGVVLWEWLTGERLFTGGTPQETLGRVLRSPIVAPSTRGATALFDGVCSRALMRVRVGRYASVDDMAADLREVAFARGLGAAPAELGAWVKKCSELASRESQTLRKSEAVPVARGPVPSERAVPAGAPPDVLAADAPPSKPAAVDAYDAAPPYAEEGTPTRARPGLAEQLAAELRTADARAADARAADARAAELDTQFDDEPTRAHRSLESEPPPPSSLFTSEPVAPPSPSPSARAASSARPPSASGSARDTAKAAPSKAGGSDSVPLPRFFTDRDKSEPERDDPTAPRLSQPGGPRISAVFGGPVPSVLSDAPAWVEELAAGGEPRLLESLSALDEPPRQRGWLWGAVLGALLIAALAGLYVVFGSGAGSHTAPPRARGAASSFESTRGSPAAAAPLPVAPAAPAPAPLPASASPRAAPATAPLGEPPAAAPAPSGPLPARRFPAASRTAHGADSRAKAAEQKPVELPDNPY